MKVTLTVLGSGTSMGVPTIGCPCAVCHSTDPHDKRTRPSVMLQYEGAGRERTVIIDTSPDFRAQAIREDIRRVDAVLFTHGHADHILGLDDIRAYNFHQQARIPMYANDATWEVIRRTFHYVFDTATPVSAIPQIEEHHIDGPIDLFGTTFTPVPVLHGSQEVLGFRFGPNAYLTDFSKIPDSSLPMLRGLDVLFLDALRYTEHPTHCTVQQALWYAALLKPRAAYFTHMCHDLSHDVDGAQLPPGVFFSYDGMRLEVSL